MSGRCTLALGTWLGVIPILGTADALDQYHENTSLNSISTARHFKSSHPTQKLPKNSDKDYVDASLMDWPTITRASVTDRQRNLYPTFLQRNAFGIWVFTGFIVNWSILLIISREALGATIKQIVAFGLFFIPLCMTILAGSVAHWHGRWAQCSFGHKTRIVASCIVLDMWVVCCALVYFYIEGPMWIAAWWYVFLPVIIWTVNRFAVEVIYEAM